MELSPVSAISPIDGRYRNKTGQLADFFSEAALIKFRVLVETEYFIALCRIPLPGLENIGENEFEKIRSVVRDFSLHDAEKVKEIEKTTNHDVKAVEYYVKEKFQELGLADHLEFVHFGLTSQDINNTAVPYSVRQSYEQVMLPALEELISTLEKLSMKWLDVAMLARTHGQPASPTRLGKEVGVFVERLRRQVEQSDKIRWSGKFGGATGNFNAHVVAYPDVDWIGFGNKLLKNSLGLTRQQVTTQIEHYDDLAAFFDNMKRINTILVDLSRDMWSYISLDYFKQKIKEGEIGSSAMPHKVNPIDFENAEGNLGISNAVFAHLAEKLPISRLQRDLTDSTVTRNIGVPLAHMLISIKSLRKGLDKLILNEEKIRRDLEDNWAVVAEAIQTILRREKYPQPYETLKKLTRTNEKITQETLHDFIRHLDLDEKVKQELLDITPWNYTGIITIGKKER